MADGTTLLVIIGNDLKHHYHHSDFVRHIAWQVLFQLTGSRMDAAMRKLLLCPVLVVDPPTGAVAESQIGNLPRISVGQLRQDFSPVVASHRLHQKSGENWPPFGLGY